jgi:hypothetical protein
MKDRSRSSSIPAKRSNRSNGQKSAHWIAGEALRELKSVAAQKRLQQKTA